LHGSELAAPPTKEVGGNGHTATEAASLRSAVVDREGATNSFGGVIVPDERGYIVVPAVVAVPLAALVAYREEVSTRGMADYQHFERIHRPFVPGMQAELCQRRRVVAIERHLFGMRLF